MKNRLECMQSIRFLAVLLMCCLSYTTWAQTQSNVNGLVTDFSGEPLIGVSILVKGTSNGTVTDLDGKFSLSAEMGNMLQISYVGYISQEVKVESDKLLRIIMYLANLHTSFLCNLIYPTFSRILLYSC